MPDQTENASERPNAGLLGDLYAESTDAVYVYDAVTDDWSGFTRFGHAVEVPADAVPLHGRSVAEAEDEVGQVLKANKELRARAEAAEAQLEEWTLMENDQARRADAAEAKLATLGANLAEAREELEIARLPHEAPYVDPEHQGGNCIDVIMQKIGETLTAERERDEARVKLDQVREVILDFGQPENKLQPIEVIEKIDEIVGVNGESEPVTDRKPSTVDRVRSTLEMLALRERDQVQRQRDELAKKLDQLRADIEDPRGLGEEIALAIQDVYSGETFADPVFERGTDAVLNVLRERLTAPVTDREEPAQAPEISGAGVPFEQSTGPKRDQCGASSPNGRKQCIRHRGHAGEHMSSVIDTQWASEEPAGETNPDDEHADDCTGCNGPGIVPCAADEVIGRFAYRNGECIKDLEARFGEGLEVVERQADSEAQR